MSLLFGDRSALLTVPRRALLRRSTPPETPWVEIPDAGHHVMVDQPLALVAALRTQLEAWQPAAAGTD
jgi:pimeloyl-ACP methyl ester carboxylesterase